MIREKSHCIFLPLDSRNSLIMNRVPHEAGLLCPPDYTFNSWSCTSTYKFCLTQGGSFVLWMIRVYLETREFNPCGSRFMIGEKSHWTFLTCGIFFCHIIIVPLTIFPSCLLLLTPLVVSTLSLSVFYFFRLI